MVSLMAAVLGEDPDALCKRNRLDGRGEWQSNALWETDEHLHLCEGVYGKITIDTHLTEERARQVCKDIEERGFRGYGERYPVKTWVSGIQRPPRLPPNVQIDGLAAQPAGRAQLWRR